MPAFSFPSGTKNKVLTLLMLAILVGWTSLTLTSQPDPSAPGNHLPIMVNNPTFQDR